MCHTRALWHALRLRWDGRPSEAQRERQQLFLRAIAKRHTAERNATMRRQVAARRALIGCRYCSAPRALAPALRFAPSARGATSQPPQFAQRSAMRARPITASCLERFARGYRAGYSPRTESVPRGPPPVVMRSHCAPSSSQPPPSSQPHGAPRRGASVRHSAVPF